MTIPLGEIESQRLEFKASEALSRPEIIAREVVAMLNAEGGELWVGLKEAAGRAVDILPIPNAERARDSLHDSLIDTISPSPSGSELRIEIVEANPGEKILRLEVEPRTEARPYALLRSGRWQFLTRVGARNRPLTRDEIREKFSVSAPGLARDERELAAKGQLEERVLAEREKGTESFLLVAEPVERKRLDLAALRDSGYLTHPERLGDRRFGHSIANAAWLGGHELSPSGEGLRIGREGIFWLSVSRSGGVSFTAPLLSFFRPGPANRPQEKALFPLAVLEYPTSVFRLMARLYSDESVWEDGPPASASKVFTTVAVFGLRDWILRPGSPRDWSFFDLPSPSRFSDAEFVLADPVVLAVEDVVRSPDSSAKRLWGRIYEAFGFWPEHFPSEFDASTGRLVG